MRCIGLQVFTESIDKNEEEENMMKSSKSMGLWRVALLLALILLLPMTALAAPKVIKLAHGNPGVDILHKDASDEQCFALVFKSEVESLSQGQIQVKIYPANQLGSEEEMLEACRLGSVQIAIPAEGPMGNLFPPIQTTSVPYLMSSYPVAYKVYDGWFGQELNKALIKSKGIRLLATMDNLGGFRNFITDKSVKSASDLKGLKIRVMGVPSHAEMVKLLGASPTPMAYTEVYPAMQQGVIDGLENPPGVVYTQKLWEIADYYVLDRHLFSTDFVVMNERFFQSLSADEKRVVLEAAENAKIVGRASFIARQPAMLEEISRRMTVYVPSQSEMRSFKDAVRKPMEQWLRSNIGAEWFDKILRAVDEAERELYSY